MKTIKTLLKELLGKRQKEKMDAKPPGMAQKTIENENDSKSDKEKMNPNPQIEKPKKQKEHETETDETHRDPHLDAPDAPKVGTNAEKDESESGSRELRQQADQEQRIKEAYEMGVIEGRNQQIEEKYFPMTDDGIPYFHGKAYRTLPSDDIFSIAREA